MQSSVCRACKKSLDVNSGKCILDENTTIKSFDIHGTYDDLWEMPVYSGLEIITGNPLSKEDNLPKKLCEVCFQSVEAYVNFRYHLLQTRDQFSSDYKNNSSGTSVRVDNLKSIKKPVSKVDKNNLTDKQKEINFFRIDPALSKKSKNLLIHTKDEDLINVDEDSTSLDINIALNEDEEVNKSLTKRLPNDKKNNNIETVNPVCTPVHSLTKDDRPQDISKESEIDVCSFEDDEVLELDIPKKKNEIVEIVSSSSESDIEVCDDEPPCKRKTYSTLTPPIRF